MERNSIHHDRKNSRHPLLSCWTDLCEPLNIRVYGMNEGQWHRLDNISAIMCMANLFVYFMDNRQAAHF